MKDASNAEKILRDYYRKLNEIYHKKQLLCVLNQNVNDVKKTLLYAYELLPIQEMVLQYKAVSGSYNLNNIEAKRYNQCTAMIEQFKNFLIELTHRQLKLKMQIMYLESEVEGLTFALGLLDSYDRIICESSYGLQVKSNIQIGSELKMDEKTIRYRKKKIISQLLKNIELDPNNSILS